MQRISNSLFEAINKVTSGQALNEATDGEKKPVKKGEGHKPAWLLAAEIRAEKKEGKLKEASGGTGMKECKPMKKMKKEDAHMKENMEMPEAPEPEEKIEAPSLNDKIKAMAMKKAAQTDNGNAVQALSARGPGADVKEEVEEQDESVELSEASRQERAIMSVSKMKDLEKAGKKNTKMGRMADVLHMHAQDAFEGGDHKKIDRMHKFYHEMSGANKKDKMPEHDILKGSKHVFKEESITEKEKWIAGAIKKPGSETAAAKKAGMSVHAYAEKHKHDSDKAGKRARLALTLEKLPRHHGKRNEEVEGVDEVFRVNSVNAQTAASAKAHHYNELKKKADSGDKDSKERLAYIDKTREAKRKAFDARMDEGVTETIVKHNDFVIEVTDNPTYGDFLRAIRSISDPELVSEAEAIQLASDAYDVGYDEIIVEDFTRSEIMDKHAAHRKAGNTVSHEKFGSRDGKPYAEYVVTDKEGGRKKYIHHGSTRRMESMSGKHKNAE